MNLTLRTTHPSDFETLYRIDRSCYEPGIAYSRRTLHSLLASPNTQCWAACLDDEMIGFIIALWEGAVGHVITIDVVESVRRRGVGTILLAQAEREMSRGGVGRVDLETATNNQPAIAFWTKHGYHAVALYPGYYQGRTDAYLMSKRLAPAHGPK